MKEIIHTSQSGECPLHGHSLTEPSLFRPEDLVRAVREQRGAGAGSIPFLGVLDFDGDLTDKLMARNEVIRCPDWPCFHTEMWLWPGHDPVCGIVARCIGGPYTVLIAEQMAVCGVTTLVGLASAGRIGTVLPLPGIVVADVAIRDEGTSLHYLPPSESVQADQPLAAALTDAMSTVGLPVRRGAVWTTDAPYRETASQIDHWAARGVLAVEMQAASLFAFGQAKGVATGLVAHVTNATDHDGEPFHKGPENADLLILKAISSLAS